MRGFPLAAAVLLPVIAFAAPPLVVAKPDRVVLGSGTTVELKVQGDGGPLRGFTSVGTLEQDPQVGAAATFRLRPPDIRYPTTAVLVFWTRTESANDIAVVRIPLLGRTELKISTEPRAKVHVELPDRKFGPVTADSKGKALVPIEVPPHIRSARVHVDAGGQKSTRNAPIDVPDTNPLAAAFSEASFQADQEGTLVVAHQDGIASGVEVKVSGGTARPRDRGRDVAIYSVEADRGRNDVSVTLKSGSWSVDARSVVRPAAAAAAPPTVDPAVAIWPFAGVGAFFSGGANSGPALLLGAGRALVPNVTLEVELGLRTAGMSSAVNGGTLASRVFGVPLQFGARLRLLQLGNAAVDARAGLGVQLIAHALTATFQPAYSELGLRPDGFVGVSGAFKLGAFEPFAELRGQWGLVTTDLLNARLGGVMLVAGTRYAWR